MTDGFPAPVAVANTLLAATVTRVAELAGKLGRDLNQVFDLRRLSEASGVPADVVRSLLDGRPAGELDLQTRFLQRLDLLRRTRVKPNGRRYTQQEIADGAAMSRQQAGALINGDRRPTMEHCDAIQRFFGVHAGFLTANDADALTDALQRTEQQLLQDFAGRARETSPTPAASTGDPLARLLQNHGVRGIAWRAAQLPSDKHRDKVTEWLDMLLESVKPNES
ncbi:helix-turn-helix transcriptional regulator [Streptomyces sp. H27-H1]|uniref:helix-turn-helix domain-containing protein n=1 Tax=unclassified Streptomyces TaxID=2593676 RepID=UPI00226E1ABA|nr:MULTISPECIES: helix-turn-helix transcriptional regulator [unclassified Streptomyces]MCY0928258.1 helix-turn-helix transcriptional regulator [Streptomyces sp. H27-H1]MCY0935379.1 helix-turn-helix transcriptional regulator [Streptomyces sp. H34-S4]